jgi:DNA-binding transcriptional MerR regulator|tara:strand:- start:135 stop:521 length:387 start_codon:yes stop_codon:yes gene_type:complete
MNKLINISELSKILNLIDSNSKKPLNHVLRYWEKEFKQIRPKKINNRRYYSLEQVEIVKMIKFLLKNKGMTILGVKSILDLNINKLDDYNSHSLKAEYYKKNLKLKSKSILEKIKKIKNYGKKNTLKS